jgi:hypothetical protein
VNCTMLHGSTNMILFYYFPCIYLFLSAKWFNACYILPLITVHLQDNDTGSDVSCNELYNLDIMTAEFHEVY